jgi:hypothetical protein
MIKKATASLILLLCFYSCGKQEANTGTPEQKYEYAPNSEQYSNEVSDTVMSNRNQVIEKSETTTNEQTTDGLYHNDNKDEVFHYNNMYLKPKKLKGKYIKVMAVVSFQGDNRNTLILGITTPNSNNLRGVYVMNSYIGKSNGLEIFKYEKVEGDNENEYFTFGFGDDGKLTVTNLTNKDIFIFENTPNY